jgi:hypothetical protein
MCGCTTPPHATIAGRPQRISGRVELKTVVMSFCMILIAAACGGEKYPLKVGGTGFSSDEMSLILDPFRGDSAAVSSALDGFIGRQLLILDAGARGLDTLPEIRLVTYERAREKLMYAYLMYKLGSVVVPDDSLHSFYDAMGTVVGYTVMNVADSALAESLYALTLAGADLGDLVRRFSTIEIDVQSSGWRRPRDMQRISPDDRRMLDGLEQGGVSRPMLFQPGWRFAKLDSLMQVEPPPFEEVRDEIYDFIWAHMSEEYRHVFEDSLRTASGLAVSDGAPEIIVAHAINPRGEFTPYTEDEGGRTAYSWCGGSRTIYSLAFNIMSLPPVMPRNATDTVWVREYCMTLGLYDVMAWKAREMGLDLDPRLALQIRTAVEDEILDAYFERIIGPRIEPSEEDIDAAWEQNRDMLLVPERRTCDMIAATDSTQLRELESMLARGADPLESPELFTGVVSLLQQGEAVRTRPLSAGDMPEELARVMFDLEPGEAAACSLRGGNMVYFRVAEIVPERVATLEEAHDQLAGLLRSQVMDSTIAALVDSLGSVYPCVVDSEFVDRFRTALPDQQPEDSVHIGG